MTEGSYASWCEDENDAAPPEWLKPRKSRRPHRLPKGWRWLRIGEWIRVGDYCCDARIQPVQIIVNRAWKMTKDHHPVRRKVK